MEWLGSHEIVVDENTYHVVVPAKHVIELVPFVLLLPEIEHAVDIPVHLEVLVIAKPSKENCFVST